MTSSTSSYARILAHYPYVVIAVVFVVAATCLVVSVTVGDRPDFDDPKAGFESRGTEISDRLITKHNLDNTLDLDHRLTLTPYSYQQNDNIKQRTRQHQRKGKKKGRKKQRKRPGQQNSTRDQVTERWDNDLDRGFCQETPDPRYIRIVFSAVDGENLFTLENIKSMCAIERDIQESYPRRKFKKICGKLGKHCCLSWSLGNYIALLSNKTFCEEIVESDVDDVMALLLSCGEYYHSYQLNLPCDSAESSCNISSRCREYSAVYSILHYLTDIRFLRPDRDKSEPDKLQFSISFFPIAQSVSTLEFYRHLEKRNLRHGNVYITAANFGIKYTLFDEYLLSDTVWLIIAACVIFCAIWLYSTSLFVTVMAILAMFWSLEIAYFIYMMVFEIKFFPYMNMVTVIIMIGVGADDTLIYCKVWHLSKSERNNGTLEKIITDTLKHATLSMLVTSLTSAAAFLSNYVSNITAIRCFSVFAGTAMLTNYVLMVTWIPATIVVYEKWCNCSICYQSEFQSTRSLICGYLHQAPFRIYNSISDWSRILFEKLLPCMVIKLRCFWIFSLGLLGVGGIVVIFHHPRLQLPSSREFRLFAGNHLMEVYDFEMVKHFQFEKDSMDNAPSMPVTVVWGVLPVDNGNHLEPKNQGSLEFDENFKLSTAKAQRWLLDFCSRLKQQSFYKPSPGTQWSNCFLEHFKLYMERPCELSGMDECCEGSFPYTEDVLTRCLSRYIPSLMATPGVVYTRKSPGPRFTDGKISALIVQFPTAVPFSLSYDDMAGFYSSVNRWVTEQMVNAPDEMSGGWFVSDLSFYDLQNSLVHGTPLAIGLSVAVAAVVIFFTTLNLLISIYAVITIACIIFVTIGSLALLGWELNILESVVITIAIGMSVDFTLHYAVAYRLSPDLDREMRVVCSVGHTGSAISMAAVTTFLAGALMMPSTVLVYRQFGIFLMLIMSVSWIYSTFFFQSLLRTFGPQGGFGQFHWPSFDCCSSNHREHIDKTIYALSESTLSSSSTSYPNHPTSESHELETLTDGSDTFHHRHHSHHMQLYRGGRQRHSYAPTRTEESPVHTPRRQTHVTFEPPPLNTVISPQDKDCDSHSQSQSDAVIKQCVNIEDGVEQQTVISDRTLSDTGNSPLIPQENEDNPLLGEQEKQSHAQNTHLICLDERNETVDIQNNHLPSQNVLPQENHQQNSPCSHVDHQNPQDNQNHLLDSQVEEDQSQLLKSQNMDLGGGEKHELGSQSTHADVVNPSIGALLLSVAPSVEDIVPTTRTADFIKPETQNGGEFLEPFLEPQAV